MGYLTRSRTGIASRAGLLLFMLALLAADLVVVNIREVGHAAGAAYGPVILWDVTTFFAWLHVIRPVRASTLSRVAVGGAVALALKAGREILVMNDFTPTEPAGVDFFFGELLLTAAWAFWLLNPKSRAERAVVGVCSIAILWAAIYWTLTLVTGILMIGDAPLYRRALKTSHPRLERTSSRPVRLPSVVCSCTSSRASGPS